MASRITPGAKSADWHLAQTVTPLRLSAWKSKLKNHPDQDYVCFLLKGIEEGFLIGVDPDRLFKCAKRNMLSAERTQRSLRITLIMKWGVAIS